MKMAVRKILVCCMMFTVSLVFAPWSVLGSGLESGGIGARGRAMGSAMIAVADDWTAVSYNPAGLVQIQGSQWALVCNFFSGGMESTESLRNLPVFSNPDPARGDFIDPIGDEPRSFNENSVGADITSGEFGYASGKGRFAFGVGFYGSGAGSGWDDGIQTSSGDDISAEISFVNASVNVPLALAYRVADNLSLGVTVALRYGLLDADINKVREGTTGYSMKTSQETDGFGISADVGALWSVSRVVSLGAVARLPYTIEKTGETTVENSLAPLSVSSGTTVREHIPLRLGVGVALRPNKKNIIAFSMTRLNWSDYDREIEYDDPVPFILEDSSGNPADWEDTMVYNLGYEGLISERWTLRGGLTYDEAPEPPEARTLVGGQVLDVWKFSVGTGYRLKKTELNLGYTHTYGQEDEGYIPGAQYEIALHEIYVGIVRKFR